VDRGAVCKTVIQGSLPAFLIGGESDRRLKWLKSSLQNYHSRFPAGLLIGGGIRSTPQMVEEQFAKLSFKVPLPAF